MMQIALFGNPNIGKTSLFNQLTGSYEYVGNWSGVTVEEKIGLLKNKQAKLVDLPGTYSLNPLSRDERVVTEFLLRNHFTSIINIVDASQLQRNLHLTIELLEFGKPLMIGLNMIDVAKSRGIEINIKNLSNKLGVAIQPIIARTGKGCNQLLEKITYEEKLPQEPFRLDYGVIIETGISKLVDLLYECPIDLPSKRWLAIQFYSGNDTVKTYLERLLNHALLLELLAETEKELLETTEQTLQDAIFEKREQFIRTVLNDSVVITNEVRQS